MRPANTGVIALVLTVLGLFAGAATAAPTAPRATVTPIAWAYLPYVCALDATAPTATATPTPLPGTTATASPTALPSPTATPTSGGFVLVTEWGFFSGTTIAKIDPATDQIVARATPATACSSWPATRPAPGLRLAV
jgi:hypothetical protein